MTDCTPYFSICVPVYNVQDYLTLCIDSLLSQTFKSFEIILVNDGSSDASPAICNRYAEQYPDHVKVIHQNNRGLYYTRRTAFKESTGRYCLCVDSDDTIAPGALETLHNAISLTDAQVVLFDWTRSDDFSVDREGLGFCGQGEVCLVPEESVLDLLLTTRKLNNMCFKAFSSDCLSSMLLEEGPESLQYGEDLYATLALIGSSSRFAYVSMPLYYYRQNEASLTHTFNQTRFEDIAFVRRAVRKFAEERYGGDELEKVLEGVSRVDIMQVIDLAEMICLSDEHSKTRLLDELVVSPLYRVALTYPNARVGLRVDYSLLLRLLDSRKYYFLELSFRSINHLRPLVRRCLRIRH